MSARVITNLHDCTTVDVILCMDRTRAQTGIWRKSNLFDIHEGRFESLKS